MNQEPRHQSEYSTRQTEAARRVLVDVGQVLASFRDCLVVVGGWVPDLLITSSEEPHVGSIDVDLALDVEKLSSGRYAELLKLLIDTRRYRQGSKPFQLVTEVDLGDDGKAIQVEVEFLAPKEVRLRKNKPKLIDGFRVLQADGCIVAFNSPEEITISGQMINNTENSVRLLVASLPDFLVMKAYALAGRDKPKDSYDLCYCLEYYPDGMAELAHSWKQRQDDAEVIRATEILREKFASVNHLGPMQYVEFLDATDPAEREMQARRAYELVNEFLRML